MEVAAVAAEAVAAEAAVVQCGGEDVVMIMPARCVAGPGSCLGSLKQDFLCMNVNVCKCYMNVKIVSPVEYRLDSAPAE